MTFLAPWFALAGLAIAAPIIMHLIRRDIRGERLVSTLRFLSQKAPPPTQKKRIEHWFLLLLRALVLLLLAVMFTRPFFRSPQAAQLSGKREIVAILIDVSASMKQGDRFKQAVALVDGLIAEQGSNTNLQIYACAHQTDRVWGDWRDSQTISRSDIKLAELVSPTWLADDLPAAIETILADYLALQNQDQAEATPLRLHVVSDFASAYQPAWQRIDWPIASLVHLHPVESPLQETASWMELLLPTTDQAKDHVRVRVSNGRDSPQETLRWESGDGAQGETISVGRGRSVVIDLKLDSKPLLVQLTREDELLDRLTLPPRSEPQRSVIAIGSDTSDRSWILEQAVTSIDSAQVTWQWQSPQEELVFEDREQTLFLIEPPAATQLAAIQQLLERGGRVVACLSPAASSEQLRVWEETLKGLLGLDRLSLRTSTVDTFQTIKGVRPIDASDLVETFDPRFDFGETRVWKSLEIERDPQVGWPLSELDRGAPWLFRYDQGRGRVLVMTVDWEPTQSQLARSSRFAPLVAALAGLGNAPRPFTLYEVGQVSNLATLRPIERQPSQALPDRLELWNESPGLYQVAESSDAASSSSETEWAILQVANQEWRSNAGAIDEIRNAGLPKTQSGDRDEGVRNEFLTQISDERLEREQQMWRWVLMFVGLVLAAESGVAWWAIRRRSNNL